MAPQRPFRIVHLSDLHLTPADDMKRSEPRLFGNLRGMNEAFRKILGTGPVQRADLVLVTGDVTDRGDLDAWRVFWKAVRQAGLVRRTAVIPGNHDVCWLGLARLPSDDLQDKDLERVKAGLKIGKQPTKFPWVLRPDQRVVLFGLNSNNLGNLGVASNAMGEVGYFQLKSLASKLYQYRDVPVKIVALHHSPNIPEVETARKRGQKRFSMIDRLTHQIPQAERRGLRLLCETHRVRLILHGHLHMKEDRRVTGVRIVGAPATTQPIRKRGLKHEYGFFTFTVQGAASRVSCKFTMVRV